ncbi:MAG: flagellar M-ring protein FliF [Chthonomonadaceae bacterium]|nr:flagellar M-ring protein FliF [Chthonomonadaceae bacterium]
MLIRVREWWMSLERKSQILLGASSLGVLIALIGFVSWASTPEFVPLFSSLSPQDAAAIAEKLKEAKVPYRSTQNLTAIEVPAQKRDELRLQLMNQGLPQQNGRLGNEILDKISGITTGAMESKRFLQAEEGEIARSIMTLEQVADARVLIVPSDDSPFTSQKNQATASVTLTMKSGQTIDDGNVRTIVRMVTFAVSGLSENRVSVADSHGNLLHDPLNTGINNASDRNKQQLALAKQKRDELQNMLDRTLGQGKSVLNVNVELNTDQTDTEKTIVETGAVVSKETATDKVIGTGAAPPTGSPGLGANTTATGTPTYDGNNKGGKPGEANVERVSTQSVPSTTKTVTKGGSGKIERMTVSAMVDTSIKPEQVAGIKEILLSSIGGKPEDKERLVTVTQIAFDRSAAENERKAAEASARAESMSKTLSIAVPLVLMTAFFLMLARAFKRTQQAAMLASNPQLALAGAGGMGMGGMYALPDGSMSSLILDANGNPMPGQMVDSLLSAEHRAVGVANGSDDPHTYEIIEQAFDSQMESIQHMVKTKPEMVAALLKGWTVDEA